MRFGVEARWWAAGPVSGQRFLRGLVPDLAIHPELPGGQLVLFTPEAHPAPLGNVDQRHVFKSPAPIFNGVGVQLSLPDDIESVLYQSLTPPISRSARAVVVHDLIYLRRPEWFTRAELTYFRLIPVLLPRAEVVVTVSEHVRGQVLDRFPKRDPSSVCVVPNGVDSSFFVGEADRKRQADRAATSLAIDGPYMVAVGRINPRKNLARLLKAFRAAALDDITLVLVGPRDGPTDPELDRLLASDRGGRHVRWMGRVDDALLPGLYAGATAACYVSLDEGFGVPPLEAMAAGVPVLLSDIPPHREVAGDTALLVDPLDVEAIRTGLERLSRDTSLRRGLSRRGVERASRYPWSTAADMAIGALRRAAAIRVPETR